MARTNTREFNKYTFISDDGKTLYHMPIMEEDIGDLKDFGATKADLVTMTFNGTDNIKVLFLKTDNMQLAIQYWQWLDERHNEKIKASRCMVPGRRKEWIICPKENNCNKCPYGKKPADKERNTISWDGLIEKGYEPVLGVPVEAQVIAKIEDEDMKAEMEKEDSRLWIVLQLNERQGIPVKEIAKKLKLSSPMVYKLLDRAKAFRQKFKEEYDHAD